MIHILESSTSSVRKVYTTLQVAVQALQGNREG
jgi:hypothetical protein